MKTLKFIVFILTVIGALNWGLVGFFRFDLVASIFGEMSTITRLIYALIGVSGIVALITMFRTCLDEM